ncbi:sensor histidine kinase [Alkalimarinus sediminis]|uniref:histidine kinase n=1 Tax=Alkalimarinus sediminis TaxID=1632866 RepID=A0A9E8HIM3_9ALTE|nr:sensor histidine kinase [Alkalimarinus sediminis]UZW75358.1 ATP-binding protein [Alkalimarinus sediminis]
MSFNLIQLFIIGLAYLLVLFGIAWATDKGFVPKRIVRHPLTYILSLGVYASAWAFYGSVGLAYEYGYGFLAYYLGVCGAFLLAPVLMLPILRITRAYQLSSLADLFAFRYRSQFAGTLVTLFTLMGTLALLSLQIQAVTNSIQILAPDAHPNLLGFVFCLVIIIFAFLFGARSTVSGENNDGLVMSIAFESIVKLIALMAVGYYAVSEVFGGFDQLNEWLQTQGPRVTAFDQTIADAPWRALLLIFFASALVMPHMFHMSFTENQNPQNLFKATWGLPLYLLLISLPIPPILWAGINLNAPTVPEYYTLGVSLSSQSPTLSIIAFIGGLSAASGMIIVTTLALAGMVLNHFVLPIYPPKRVDNIYSWLKWVKRGLIAIIIFLSYLFYLSTSDTVSLSLLGILAFSAMLQLLPGVLAVLYWPIGNRNGVISGMIVGITIWGFTMLSPLMFGYDAIDLFGGLIDYRLQRDDWHIYTFFALTANVSIFALVSILTQASRAEEAAAQACSVDTLSRPQRRELVASSSSEFKECLSKPLGAHVANREVERALNELNLPAVEYRPYALRRLRDQIEANLSGLMGPSIAQDIVKRNLSYKQMTPKGPGHDIHFVERSLEDYQSRLTGLAAELDSLRRYHRQTLQNLPIAACSLGHDLEILMWNQAMMSLTEVSPDQVIGSSLSAIPSPWAELLNDFAQGDLAHQHKKRVDLQGHPHWFNLHKSLIAGPQNSEGGLVILLEDQTENQLLEEKLIHSSRLASVGRFAAGVAHEIGNPVTGIACLAQNMKLETDDKEMLSTAQQIIDQTKRISNILQSLMNFSRSGNHSQTSASEPANIHRCIQEATNLLSLSDLASDIEYHNDCDTSLTVMGDEQRLVQVFINLLSNARDASPAGSVIKITGKIDGYSVIIDVTDQGSGIPQDQLNHIFEPFYTTKDPNKGTGLGLSLVYSIIEEHYGQIQVISPADEITGKGTIVKLSLPAHQSTNDETDKPAL